VSPHNITVLCLAGMRRSQTRERLAHSSDDLQATRGELTVLSLTSVSSTRRISPEDNFYADKLRKVWCLIDSLPGHIPFGMLTARCDARLVRAVYTHKSALTSALFR
jgi:hypothetical protein